MKVTIEKKTDQLNFEDFLGGVTRIIAITGVKKGTREQQYDISIEGDSRYWRPPATVLKMLVSAWGDETDTWIGRRALLYGDPDVMMAGQKVGGIRVSHLSHIEGPVTATLSITRGKRDKFTVDPLPADAPSPAPTVPRIQALRDEWKTADPERQKAIEAEVAALSGGAS